MDASRKSRQLSDAAASHIAHTRLLLFREFRWAFSFAALFRSLRRRVSRCPPARVRVRASSAGGMMIYNGGPENARVGGAPPRGQLGEGEGLLSFLVSLSRCALPLLAAFALLLRAGRVVTCRLSLYGHREPSLGSRVACPQTPVECRPRYEPGVRVASVPNSAHSA